MIPLRRIPLLFGLFLTFTATGYAQKFCTVSPPSPYKHNAEIVTSYDQRARRMKTTLEHPNDLGNGLHLAASFYYTDPRLRVTPMIDIIFVAASKQLRFRDAHDLSLRPEGNSAWAFSGPAQYSTGDGPKGMKLERNKITLSYTELLNITKARRVRVRLGATEFELSNNHLEALREVASLMAPPPIRIVRR
ncbi:MAG TPA: hypothetical protein VJ715_17150 [Pyrinomonadaceae bacterium]|nr:hypothetical protein [Pyrinomonadaceae bacterium]